MYEEFEIVLLTHIFPLLQEIRGELKTKRSQLISVNKQANTIFEVRAMFKQNGENRECLEFSFLLLILSCSEEKAKETSTRYSGITEPSVVLIQINCQRVGVKFYSNYLSLAYHITKF